MNPRARRILRRTFIAAFFIIAPAIILSTAGYRYNFSRQRFERTGAMLVETRPADASVSLGGVPQKSLTPARLQGLSPGPYSVRVEKPGYLAWEKTVSVRSRETTFLNDIALFRDTAPSVYADPGATFDASFSHDARYAAAVAATGAGAELVIIDLRDGSAVVPYRSSAGADEVRLAWSRDGRRLLIVHEGREPEHLLWEASEPGGVRDLSEELSLAIDAAAWAQDDDRLYAAADGELYEIDMLFAFASSVGPAPSAFVVAGGTVYGILPGSPARLVKHRLGGDAYETVAELPSADFTPLPGRDRKIAYVSPAAERLFIIDPASGRQEAFEGRGAGGAWSADGRRLLYWNDLEVHIYDAQGGSDTLVTRLSGPIRQAAWHRPEWSAVYASGDTLFAVETSDRFGRVTVPLAAFDGLRAFAMSRNGDWLYAFGRRGDQDALWRLRLR